MTFYQELPSPKLISNESTWRDCTANLEDQPILAIDLEANSLFAYRERVCLIQISIPGHDYIIDPLANIDLDVLGDMVQNPAYEKIFHAAEYDMILLKREFGWDLDNLFDTMWAARILGYSRYGLANMLEQFYGVKQNKKYQKTNWCQRPLSDDQRRYAQIDTHYLLQLRNDLSQELRSHGRLQEAQEIFAEQAAVRLPSNSFDPDGFWKINGVGNLPGQNQAVARALFLFRNQQASNRDRPPFKIFHDRTIYELAEAAPRHLGALEGIHGMSQGQKRRFGRSILRVIEKAFNDPIPKRPKRRSRRTPEAIYNRYERLRKWRKQSAQRRGVESDVIISTNAMWAIARANPLTTSELNQLEGLGPWRRQAYGEDIIETLGNR